jgi:hypothetical protein
MAWISLTDRSVSRPRPALRLVVKEPAVRRPPRSGGTPRTVIRVARAIALIGAAGTFSAATAHVLALPNKLQLDGPLWLAVQQHLYRGWGLLIGPCEVGAIISGCVLVYLMRRRRTVMLSAVIAAACMMLALLVFAAINAPVNAAVDSWTVTTLPANWPAYRLRSETGHAITCALALTAVIAMLRAMFTDVSARRD